MNRTNKVIILKAFSTEELEEKTNAYISSESYNNLEITYTTYIGENNIRYHISYINFKYS